MGSYHGGHALSCPQRADVLLSAPGVRLRVWAKKDSRGELSSVGALFETHAAAGTDLAADGAVSRHLLL